MEIDMDIRDHIHKDPDKLNKKLPDILVEDDKKSPQRSEMKEYLKESTVLACQTHPLLPHSDMSKAAHRQKFKDSLDHAGNDRF
jgi:hypothetical protein